MNEINVLKLYNNSTCLGYIELKKSLVDIFELEDISKVRITLLYL